MRRWQLILELSLHYTLMTVSLHLCFPLGRSERLPLVACYFILSWSRFAENRIVLGNVSWQFGPSLFVLRHFFLLGVGLGLDMKWAGVAKFFGPTIAPLKSCCPASRAGRKILMFSSLCHGKSSLVLHERQSLFACPRHAPGVSVYETRGH